MSINICFLNCGFLLNSKKVKHYNLIIYENDIFIHFFRMIKIVIVITLKQFASLNIFIIHF